MKKVMVMLAVVMLAGNVYGWWTGSCEKDCFTSDHVHQWEKGATQCKYKQYLEKEDVICGMRYCYECILCGKIGIYNGSKFEVFSAEPCGTITLDEPIDNPIEGHLRWIYEDALGKKGHLEFYDGSEWQEIEKDEPATYTKITVASVDFVISQEPEKPYLYQNPNNDHWTCSVHGDLNIADIGFTTYAKTISFFDGPEYCWKCVEEIVNKMLSEHIIGIKDK